MPRDDASDHHEERLPADWPQRSPGAFGAGRERQLADVRDVQFPIARRGYDRDAVDDYLERVNQTIAELEATRSPEAAVRRALERVGEETSGILQRANETAEEISRRSRAQADDRLQEADREARALRQDAEARVQEVEAELQALWRERERLIEETRRAASELLEVADAAAGREPPEPPRAAEDTAQMPALGAEPATEEEPAGVAEAAEPVEAVEPGEAAAQVQPAEQVEAAEPVEAVEPREAVEPGEAAEPAEAEGEPHPDGPIPGHPYLEPEPPDRELPDEGIVRVEAVEGDEQAAGPLGGDEPDDGEQPPERR